MSIKKDNVIATAVKYNNQDVNKVILDNECVWCKAFTYTQGTLPTGVASLTCTRSSTDEPTASAGTISNGGTIYYDDKLYWTATASTGYRITAVKGSNSPVTVTGAVTGTTASGLTSARISGTISQGTLPTGVASIKCYRKAYNGSSFSEYTGSTIYYGDQFYWTATATTEYNNPSLTYNSSSKTYTWNGSQGGTITSVGNSGLSAGSRKTFTITFGTTSGATLYGSWSKSSQTAEYGDKITVSGTTVTCYKWNATSTARWTTTVTSSANTAQYTYSSPILLGSSITSVTAAATFTASNTRTLNSYTITWKYLSAYPDTWTTATEAYTYGATPSRTASNVTSGSARKVPTGWDSLATVTGNRTITATYKTQFNVTFSGTRCSAKIDNVAVSNGWYDSGKTVTWTADTNCAFSSNGSTTTATDTISNQKTTYTATAGYINVTSVNGNNCTAYTDNTYATAFTTGWKSYGVSIYWKASAAYAFDTSNRDTSAGLASPGANTANANLVKRYKLTISATNGGYGTYSVSRTSSPYQGAATGALSNEAIIYYGDKLTGTSSAKAVDYDSWSVTSVTAPTFTTTGAATSGNLTITNKSAYSATLYYNTSNAVGGTSAGTAAANGSQTVTGLSFNTQYYISARVARTRTKHTYALDGTQYSGTSSVTGNVTASFKFKMTNTTESGTIDSSVVAAKTAAQSTYTVTWKYLKAYPDTWESSTTTVAYGATPSKTNPSTVTSGNERKVFASWDNLAAITGSRTITATYTTQYAPTISPSYCTANRTSNTWYNAGTVITWTANDNYSFGGSAVKDTTTTTITAGNVTYSKSPGYVKCTISGTRCTPSKTSGSILAVGTDITYTASSGYSFTEHATTASNPTKHTVALGTTSYSRSCDYQSITVSGTNCSANIASGYRKIGATITWTATSGTNYKYSFSNTNVDSATATATVALGTTTYSKTASYLWYNVTITPSSNCTANKSSGYHLNGTVVTFTATAATTSKRYSFSTSSSTTTTCTKTVSAPNQSITNDTVYTYMNCTFSGNNCTKPTNGWYRVGTSQTFTASTGTNLKYSFTNTTANSPSTTASVTIADGTTAYTKNADYIFYNVTITKNTGTSSATYSSGYLLNGTTVTFTANASTSTIRYSYSNTASTTNTQSYTVSSAGQTISSGTVYTWCNITVNSTNCTASVASGWRLNGTTITWTPLPNYSFSEGTTQTNATATVSTSSFAYSAAPVYVKPASVSLVRCTCAVNTASKYYDSRQAYLVTADTNCAFNSTGTTTTQSLTLTAGATVAYSAGYLNVTKLTGTNCSTTTTTGWKQAGTKITWTANAAYAFNASNLASTQTIVSPGENTCTASYVKRYTLSVTKNANVSSIKVWRESSPYQNAATSTQTSPLVNGTGTETVYYGDTIAGSATAATYYHFSGYADTQTSLSMAGTITDNYSWTPTVVGNGYAVTIAAGKGISSVYLSSSSTATSGSASGSNFPYGSTVYGFVALNRSLISSITVPSGWVAVGSSDNLTYRVGSGTVTASGYNFGTVNATLAAYTVQVTAGTGVTKVYLSTNPNDYGSTTSTATAPFYAGTTVYAFAHINTAGYTGNSNWTYIGSGNVFRVGSVYVTQAYNFGTINATPIQKYTVTISSSGVGLQNTWLSTSSTATSGSATLSVTSGSTVYGYAVLATDTYASNIPTSWTLRSGTACKQGAVYRVGSKTITAATTFDIDLFVTNLDTTMLFTRSGESVGTWTITTHVAQSMDNYGSFSKSGNTINFTGPDYNGNDWTREVATFTCPSGYIPNITMIDADGNSVAWNTNHYLNGPYTIEAETRESSSSQS